MIYPKKLKKGDTVGLVCLSSPVTKERQAKCIAAIEGMGYKVKYADNLTANYGGYMAGSGKVRGEWLNRMFADPSVDAVFCIRGGDGSSRVTEYADLDIVRANPKIFAGYSDITSFHLLFNQKCDLVTFHGPMVSSNMVDDFDAETAASFFQYVSEDSDDEDKEMINGIPSEAPESGRAQAVHKYIFKNPEGFPVKVLKEGLAEGILTGGNLTLLCSSVGTSCEVETDGKILFIEEVGEYVDRLERLVWHLRNCGKFKACRGILLGQFTDCGNRYMPDYDYVRCFEDALEGIDIPVMYHLQSGHGKPMMTLPLGAVCRMDTAKKSVEFFCG